MYKYCLSMAARSKRSSRHDAAGPRPLKDVKVVSMYQEAAVYINGSLQTHVTLVPHRGPYEAAEMVAGSTPFGGTIKVKQGRYVWTYRVTRREGGGGLRTITEVTGSSKPRRHGDSDRILSRAEH